MDCSYDYQSQHHTAQTRVKFQDSLYGFVVDEVLWVPGISYYSNLVPYRFISYPVSSWHDSDGQTLSCHVEGTGVRSLDILYEIYGEKRGTRTSVSPSTSLSSVSIIPPAFYTHMFDPKHSFKLAAS